jgi:hypothetical protein
VTGALEGGTLQPVRRDHASDQDWEAAAVHDLQQVGAEEDQVDEQEEAEDAAGESEAQPIERM